MYAYRKSLAFVLVALAVASIAGYFWMRGASVDPSAACRARMPQPVVAAFGDSLIVGEGGATPGGFISRISAETGIPIRNFGRGGDTTEAAKARVPQVLAAEPDIVFVLLGGNDTLRRVSPATTEANLDQIIGQLTDAGAHVILLGVMGDLFNDPFPVMYERLAEKHDAAYVPNVLNGLFGRTEFMNDAVHPNDAGYAIIADRVLPVFEKVCAEGD